MIRLVPSQDLPKVWPQAVPQIERILERFDYGSSTDDILINLMTGTRQLWEVNGGEGYAITRINNLPQFSVLDVSLLAGHNMGDWLEPLIDQLHMYAKALGCKYMDGFGRKGWTRKLEKYGFRPYSYDVRLEIDGR